MKKFILLTLLSIFALSSFEALYARDDSRTNTRQYEKSYTYHPKQLTNENP